MTANPPSTDGGAPTHGVGARRILVAGTFGSGKTTLAQRIGRALELPIVELDGLYHGPGWTPMPDFEDRVRELCARPAWVCEWQYAVARPLLAERAELLVWLDLPRPLVMRQVIRRTLSRRLRRTELWHGNCEPPLRTILRDPDHIIRWAWRTHGTTAPRLAELRTQRPELPIVRLSSRREVATWLATLGKPATGAPPDQIVATEPESTR